MAEQIPKKSKSQKKREAKSVEELVNDMAVLPVRYLDKLPLREDIRQEMKKVREIPGRGSKKRQIKFVAKKLREIDLDPLYEFLDNIQGGSTAQTRHIHQLEHLKHLILQEETQDEAIEEVVARFPSLDGFSLSILAEQYRKTGKKKYSREIIQILKAAQERETLKI